MGRGALIVLEGCDRAGKSTQVKLLIRALTDRGISVEARHFPNRKTTIGEVINQFLMCKKDLAPETAHLLFSANRWECSSDVKKALETGTTLIVDRYAASGAAYGASNTNRDLNWCKEPDKGLPAPDLVAFLQIEKESQESRSGWAEERFEKKEFQEKVAANFLKLADDSWEIINHGSIQEIHEKLLSKVLEVIKTVKTLSIKKLYE